MNWAYRAKAVGVISKNRKHFLITDNISDTNMILVPSKIILYNNQSCFQHLKYFYLGEKSDTILAS